MKTVYLLIGLPGCGKSTYASKIKDAKIISIDQVRQSLVDSNVLGSTYSSDDNNIVFSHFHNQIRQNIANFDKIIVDSTNARLSEREDIYSLLKDYSPKFVAVRFLDDKATCLERIKKRELTSTGVHRFSDPENALNIYEERINSSNPSLNEPLAEIIYVKDGIEVSRDQKVLIASTNQGKIDIYAQIFKELNIPCTNLKEIKVDIEVEETGKTELENAILKANAYYEETALPVLSNDSGLVIDKFSSDDQPGVLVRRYLGRELSDQEMLQVYISKLNQVGGTSTGHFNVALAIKMEGELYTQMFKPKRLYISKPSPIIKKGVPLSSLAYDEKSGKYLSEMTAKERNDYEAEAMQQQKAFIEKTFCKHC